MEFCWTTCITVPLDGEDVPSSNTLSDTVEQHYQEVYMCTCPHGILLDYMSYCPLDGDDVPSSNTLFDTVEQHYEDVYMC